MNTYSSGLMRRNICSHSVTVSVQRAGITRSFLGTLLSYAAWCVSNGRADAPDATDCSTGVFISKKLCASSTLLTDLMTAARVVRKAREGALTKRSTWRLRSANTSSFRPKCALGRVWRQGASSCARIATRTSWPEDGLGWMQNRQGWKSVYRCLMCRQSPRSQ
jgi:hypothetical protein